MHDLDAHARALIEANLYMTLGTADAEGRPWLSPVYFATADYAEFYWVSARDAAHSRNIAQRPQMSLVIFDSQVPTYHGRGLPVGNSLRTRRPRPRPPHRDLPRSGDPRGLTGDGSRRTNPRGGDQSYGRGAIFRMPVRHPWTTSSFANTTIPCLSSGTVRRPETRACRRGRSLLVAGRIGRVVLR